MPACWKRTQRPGKCTIQIGSDTAQVRPNIDAPYQHSRRKIYGGSAAKMTSHGQVFWRVLVIQDEWMISWRRAGYQ